LKAESAKLKAAGQKAVTLARKKTAAAKVASERAEVGDFAGLNVSLRKVS